MLLLLVKERRKAGERGRDKLFGTEWQIKIMHNKWEAIY